MVLVVVGDLLLDLLEDGGGTRPGAEAGVASQSAAFKAGVMNFKQISRLLRLLSNRTFSSVTTGGRADQAQGADWQAMVAYLDA